MTTQTTDARILLREYLRDQSVIQQLVAEGIYTPEECVEERNHNAAQIARYEAQIGEARKMERWREENAFNREFSPMRVAGRRAGLIG